MSEPFLGQLLFSGFSFVPRYYAACNGAYLSIAQNQALYALLGTMYGGDGRTTFRLPDLQGRTPIGGFTSVDGTWQPATRPIGTSDGVEAVTLTVANLPAHRHAVNVLSTAGTTPGPTAATFAVSGTPVYSSTASPLVVLGAGSGDVTGGSAPHPNMQPFQVIAVAIALQGLFPPRS